jgi:DNA-binding Xre family transcriptional regulator
MSQATDFKNLREVMRKSIASARLPVRDLEQRLGITHGALEKLLDGRQEIRLRHVLALSQMLQVTPADLLETGCPDAHSSPKYKMSDWLGTKPESKSGKKAAAETPPALPSAAELAELIRQTVREELEALAGTPAGAG